jgi:ABC-type multidrug transport system ATPase subunit/sugar lactone lactonase YvrE
MQDTLWKLDDVGMNGNGRPRLDAITATVPATPTAVLGQSGAGKSSLLNLLVEFEAPDRGTVVRTATPPPGRLPVYWVPQSHGLWPHLSARQHLALVRPDDAGGGPSPEDLLDGFGLGDKLDALPSRLSQGERARLSVARALSAAPAVLVLDEPLACIDDASSDRYWRLVRTECVRLGTSLVFSTHLPSLVLSQAEHVLCLRDGRRVYDGAVDDLYQRPPSYEAACCLGRTNWFEPEESGRWLGSRSDKPLCLRPERLDVQPQERGALSVVSSRHRGLFCETEVIAGDSQSRRTVYHRPGAPLTEGLRVQLRTIGLLLLALLLLAFPGTGCGRPRTPRLTPERLALHAMPPLGRSLPAPRGIEVAPDGRAFVVDTAGRILVFDRDFELVSQWAMPESDRGRPEDLTVLRNGLIAVPDTHYHRVIVFDDQGAIVRMFGSQGHGPGEFIYPVSLAEGPDGSLFICEYGSNDRVQKFTPEGEFILAFGSFGSGPGQFQRPSGIVCRDGQVLVADAINGRIQAFTDTGEFIGVLTGGDADDPALRFPYDLAIDRDGALWVPEWGAGSIAKLSADGRFLGRFGAPGHEEDNLLTPWGIAIRPDGDLLVADTGNRRIVEVAWQ